MTARRLPDPEPGFYEGMDEHADAIFEVRQSKAGNWYAMQLRRRASGEAHRVYVGHRVKLGERIEL